MPNGTEGEINVVMPDGKIARPGDIGSLDEDNYLSITGRVGHLICRNGVNTTTTHLERRLTAIDGVAEAIVIARAQPDGDCICVAIECEAEHELHLHTEIRRETGALLRPDAIRFSRTLPRTASGKVSRRAVEGLFPI